MENYMQKEVYLNITDNSTDNNNVISDPLEVQGYLSDLFKEEEQNSKQEILFQERRAGELLYYRKMAVEAMAISDILSVKILIANRIDILSHLSEEPEIKATRKGLKRLLKYVDSKLEKLKLNSNSTARTKTTAGTTNKKTALFMVYNGETMAKERSKLFYEFTFYSSPANRKGRPLNCTRKTFNNRIGLQEDVIEMLPLAKRTLAEDELKILKKLYESDGY